MEKEYLQHPTLAYTTNPYMHTHANTQTHTCTRTQNIQPLFCRLQDGAAIAITINYWNHTQGSCSVSRCMPSMWPHVSKYQAAIHFQQSQGAVCTKASLQLKLRSASLYESLVWRACSLTLGSRFEQSTNIYTA